MKLKIVLCSAPADVTLLDKLRKHLEPMEQTGIIETWHENDIQPGLNVDQEIEKQLRSADMVLLLASPDFISSGYHGIKLNEVVEQHAKKSVVLIILRPCDWETVFAGDILKKLKILPSTKKPVSLARDRDLAFFYIVDELRQIIKKQYTDVKVNISALRANDKNSKKAIQKVISLCYRRAILTPFDQEISTQAMFKSLMDCRIALQKLIISVSSQEVQAVIAGIIGELDLIERLNERNIASPFSQKHYQERATVINYAKLRIMKALFVLTKAIDVSLTLPTSFIRGQFWEMEDIDKAPEGAIPPGQERLIQMWATEEFEN